MKVYLDSCSLQRPLDGKDQIRIVLESEAVLVIIALCEMAHIDLISSEVLLFENQQITNTSRRGYALEVLLKASVFIQIDEEMKNRGKELADAGIMSIDALHLASAEKAEADYFCTCDDKLLKKAKALCEPKMRVVSPIELLEEIENDSRG
jgi:predicted nucleic acid-binding protein